MAGRKPSQPRPVAQVQAPGANAALVSAVQQLQAARGAAEGSVTGSRASGAALESLLAVLAAQGIITDDTSA